MEAVGRSRNMDAFGIGMGTVNMHICLKAELIFGWISLTGTSVGIMW